MGCSLLGSLTPDIKNEGKRLAEGKGKASEGCKNGPPHFGRPFCKRYCRWLLLMKHHLVSEGRKFDLYLPCL